MHIAEVAVDPVTGKSYQIMGFPSQDVGLTTSEGFELIPTLVVKPLPEHEAMIRPLLLTAFDDGGLRRHVAGGFADGQSTRSESGGCSTGTATSRAFRSAGLVPSGFTALGGEVLFSGTDASGKFRSPS